MAWSRSVHIYFLSWYSPSQIWLIYKQTCKYCK